MTLIEAVKIVIDTVADSKTATAIASAPPLMVSATSFLGVPWQQWMYISAFLYTLLLVAGVLWRWGSIWRRWWRDRKQ